MRSLRLILLLMVVFFESCNRGQAPQSFSVRDFESRKWEEIETLARGTTVNFGMWAGDEARNRYFQGKFARVLRERYGITLNIVPNGDVAEIVNKLLNEKGAGKVSGGGIDMAWINGENFRSARKAALLWGPFADRLPNIGNYSVTARTRDFGAATDGYEAPWQQAQFVLAYDTARVNEPPRTIHALEEWIKAHPGRFTYIAPPDFTGSVFIRHLFLHFGGRPEDYVSGFNEELYQKAAQPTLGFLRNIRPYLWRKGETYPATFKEADRLFANGEIDFTMSYGPGFASDRITRGEYPPSVRTFVFDSGTIGNFSYLGIPFNAANIPGALVVINQMISFEEAIELGRELGALFPLDLQLVTEPQRAAAISLPRGPATLSLEELAGHRLSEPDSQYLERLEDDWREKVLKP